MRASAIGVSDTALKLRLWMSFQKEDVCDEYIKHWTFTPAITESSDVANLSVRTIKTHGHHDHMWCLRRSRVVSVKQCHGDELRYTIINGSHNHIMSPDSFYQSHSILTSFDQRDTWQCQNSSETASWLGYFAIARWCPHKHWIRLMAAINACSYLSTRAASRE